MLKKHINIKVLKKQNISYEFRMKSLCVSKISIFGIIVQFISFNLYLDIKFF